MPEARYVAATSGDYDLIVMGIFKNTTALYDFVSNTLGALGAVRDVVIDIVLESIKRDYRYPLYSRWQPVDEDGLETPRPVQTWRGPEMA
jgi:DNA-binding Lrp family transcriptional regulator